MKPIAVLISDIHYNLQSLPVADTALRQAIAKANKLDVPLIVAGDLHDTKANMRAECVNALIDTFGLCDTMCFIIRGNHDAINEKSKEHALNFLSDIEHIVLISEPFYSSTFTLLPYYHDPEELRSVLKTIPQNSTIIMHQGVQGSNSGEYIQDKSAITREDVQDFRIISGHYHARQDIKVGRSRKGAVGLWSYIGNPYTLNFGEANDPEKGFQILMDDGTLQFVPTNLRKHVVIEATLDRRDYSSHPEEGDLVLIKVTGPRDWVNTQTKESLMKQTGLKSFRLEYRPLESTTTTPVKSTSNEQLLDNLIDSLTNTTKEQKDRLKELWKGL